IEDRSPREDEPTNDRNAGQGRGDQVTEQNGGGDSTSEGGEIRGDVVDGGDESLVHDVGDSDDDATRKGHGQEEAHHGRSLAEAQQDQTQRRGRRKCRFLRTHAERRRMRYRTEPAVWDGL